jgi:hypothetical protein
VTVGEKVAPSGQGRGKKSPWMKFLEISFTTSKEQKKILQR